MSFADLMTNSFLRIRTLITLQKAALSMMQVRELHDAYRYQKR